MPSPKLELWRLLGSPVPTQTRSGCEGVRAMSPIEATPWQSKIGVQVVPLFVVFQTPPDADPM